MSSKTIRIQPDVADCQSLRESISDPIYQLDIEGLYNHLAESKKKIPLFFALNVFDAMSSTKRKISFAQLSQLQNSGDRILITHVTQPLTQMHNIKVKSAVDQTIDSLSL
ncbi:MAG: hypothetical protein K2X08_01575, partial [Chlamydiales bacterium]|nr:hypothetical protein [Chlamydiales bacterium]